MMTASRRMRVTFVLPSLGFSGGLRVCATYAAALRARGHDVTAVAPAPAPMGLRRRLRRWWRGEGWGPRRDRWPSHFDATPIRPVVLERHRPVMDEDVPDADVVIATWWQTAEWVAALSPRKGAKVYLIQHDESLIENQPAERVEATWRLPMRRIAVSPWIVQRIHRKAQVPVSVVLNSVDTGQFDAPPRGKRSRPTVGLVWSAQHWKGADLTAEAAMRLHQRFRELAVVSFGRHRPDHPLWRQMGASCRINPPQSEIAGLYASCDLWLSGSRVEGFGLPVLEAMACRTPVVSTPAGAAESLLSEGGGLIVPHDDVEAMTQAAAQILALPEASWRTLSDQAYRRARRWTWDMAAERFEQELLAACDGPAASADALPMVASQETQACR